MTAELDAVPMTTLADVNPPRQAMDLRPDSKVSFIPMQDVSESGEWTGGQIRRCDEVKVGYTPFREGDVLFAKITPCMENGKGAHARGLFGGVGFGSTEFHVLRTRGDASDRFIYHWSRSPALRLKAQAFMIGSAGQQRVQPEFFDHFRVPLLPAPEQWRIASILDTIDDSIRRTEQVIAKLQQMKQGLLHDLLTRGVDEDGDLRPLPEDAPHLYKDSPLGWIPLDWRQSCVAEEFSIQAGITLGPHRAPKRFPFPYLRVANVFNRRLELSDIATLEARPAEVASRLIAPGDLLVVEGHANVGEIGRAAMADQRVAGLTLQNHLFRLRPHRLIPLFAEVWMNGKTVRAYWRRMCATSSGLNTINQSLLRAVDVAVPSEAEQQRISTLVRSLDGREADEYAALRKLTALKHGLLHDLLTGRVRVPLPAEASS